jgi:shikimate kinase
MKIVLIGFMGSGKSSVAPLVAAQLGLAVVEMDDLIVQKAGGKSIKAIFADGGESAFRQLEAEVAKELADRDNVVISAGGGAVTNPATMGYLTKQALVIELTGSFETLLGRISAATPRPLFEDVAEAEALYEQRQALYSKYAALHIATDDKSVPEVAKAVTKRVEEAGRP